jgi:peptide chain release factor 1
MDDLPDISPFRRRHEELAAQMAAPEFYGNPRAAAEVTREHQRLGDLLDARERLSRLDRERQEASELSRAAADPALRELASSELADLDARRAALREEVLRAMIPPEPTDSRNTILEVRAGTGGEEAALFAAQLVRLYQRYAERQGWRVQPISTSTADRGGVREAIFLVTGTNVYRRLKFESGVHRVQRVPVTEANGRIHTSTVTVAVLPEAEEVDIRIDPQDLEITVSRASGPGGQGVNTTDSAVQILHRPTGLIVQCADERSQIKNKARAMTVLRSRLLKLREEEEHAKYAARRRSQIGSGDRSERIRTYNFPQNRLTDHRIGLTLHGLAPVMEGEIDELIDGLHRAHLRERLAELTGDALPPLVRMAGGEDA